MKKYRKILASSALIASLAACESTPETPKNNVETLALFDHAETQQIMQGGTAVAAPLIGEKAIELVGEIPLIDHQYPHGFTDSKAATLTQEYPIRVDAHVALEGRNVEHSNDLSCDVVNIDTAGLGNPGAAYVLALTLSGDNKDSVLVSWPKSSQNPSPLYICFDDGNEPRDGVILGLSDAPR